MATDYQVLLFEDTDWIGKGKSLVEWLAEKEGFEVCAKAYGLLVLEIRSGWERELQGLKDQGVTWDEAFFRRDYGALERIDL